LEACPALFADPHRLLSFGSDQKEKFALAGALAETATCADFEAPADVALIV